VIKTVFMYFCV